MSRVEFPADEEWIELPGGGDRYLLSTHGRIYDLARRRLRATKVLAPMNRLRAALAVPGKRSPMNVTVAKEVLLAFGAAEGKPRRHASDVAAYVDGDVSNCRIENLYWVRLGSPEQRDAARRITDREFTADPIIDAGPPDEPAAAETDSEGPGGCAPGGIVSRAAVDAARAGQRTSADLTAEERREIRAWAGGPARGRLPADVIAAFDHQRRRAAVGAV